MKPLFCLSCMMLLLLSVTAQTKVNPVIKDFGAVNEVPFAVEKPDATLTYRIIADVMTAGEKPEVVNESLENVARTINLHVLGGVPVNKLHVIAVLHGPAALIVMNNDAYKQKFGVDNPNLPLLTALEKAGVQLFVCGQTLFKRNIDPKTVVPEVKVSLSAITTLTTYQLKGYAMLKW